MIPLHTQNSLDQLSWNQVQKLHSSLGLKATATTRTRRDYQRRIVESQLRPVAESIPAPTSFTCAQCPFARHIEDNRYCCQVSQTASDVKRGHWEATVSCYEALAKAEAKPQTEEVATEVETETVIPTTTASNEDDTPPNRGDNRRPRVTLIAPTATATIVLPHAKVDNGLMAAIIKRTPFQERLDNLDYLCWIEGQAQLAIERTVIGSEDEAIAYSHLRKIEADIKASLQPAPEAKPSPIVEQLAAQMSELKADTLKLFSITPFDPAILPTNAGEPEQPATPSLELEGTIHWEVPQLRGTIVGKKGATRRFWVQNDDIHIALSPNFIAKESKHPNIRHNQIREAISAGKQFSPTRFKLSPNFERDTTDHDGIGRIRQETDGRWWAWAKDAITGHPHPTEKLAINYLEYCNFASKRLALAKVK